MDITLKETGLLGVQSAEKKIVTQKKSFSVGWITSAFCNILYARHVHKYMLAICWGYFFPFLHLFASILWIYTRENYFPWRLMLYFDVFFRLRGFFLMRVEKMEGKKFARQMDIFQIKKTENATTTGWNRASLPDRIWFSYFAKTSHNWRRGDPSRNLPISKLKSGKIWKSQPFLTGAQLISSNSRLHFVILTHAETVALTSQLFFPFMNH